LYDPDITNLTGTSANPFVTYKNLYNYFITLSCRVEINIALMNVTTAVSGNMFVAIKPSFETTIMSTI